MSDLTKEYFDSAFKGLENRLDSKIKHVETGFDSKIKGLEKNLTLLIERKNDELAQMVAKGFEDLEKRLDLKDRVEKLEHEFSQLKQALRA